MGWGIRMKAPETYPQYMKAFGREEGRRLWREHKKKRKEKEVLEPLATTVVRSAPYLYTEKEGINTAFERGTAIIEMIGKAGWWKWLEPQIKKEISDNIRKALMGPKDKRDEAVGAANYGNRILGNIKRWIQDTKMAEKLLIEKEKKKNASRV